MKKTAILIGLVLVLVVAVIPASAISLGEPDYAHTNVGAIVIKWPDQLGGSLGRLCSGTLIDEKVLVTAAHCIQPLELQGVSYDETWVTFNQDATDIPEDIDDDPDYLDVAYWVYHPDYDGTYPPYYPADIALVILEESVPAGTVPKSLPTLGFMDEVLQNLKGKDQEAMQMLVVGYGTTETIPVPDYIEDASRQSGMVTFENLLQSLISTYQNDSLENARTCIGDSGGPLFHVDKKGNEVLVGLLSFSSGTSDPNVKCEIGRMFHYRLDTVEAQDFIYDNLPTE